MCAASWWRAADCRHRVGPGRRERLCHAADACSGEMAVVMALTLSVPCMTGWRPVRTGDDLRRARNSSKRASAPHRCNRRCLDRRRVRERTQRVSKAQMCASMWRSRLVGIGDLNQQTGEQHRDHARCDRQAGRHPRLAVRAVDHRPSRRARCWRDALVGRDDTRRHSADRHDQIGGIGSSWPGTYRRRAAMATTDDAMHSAGGVGIGRAESPVSLLAT